MYMILAVSVNFKIVFLIFSSICWERSGAVVECLTRDRGAAGSSLTSVIGLCP